MLREYLAIGKLIALLGAIGLLCFQSSQIHSWHTLYDAEHSGRMADRAAYAQAQKDAQAKNLATVAADKAERERITHDISQSYESELASLRADLARRLRAQAPAPQGAPGQPGLPGVSQAPGGSDGSSRVSIPTDLYVRGAELELQLERLQQWVAEQVKVDPNGK